MKSLYLVEYTSCRFTCPIYSCITFANSKSEALYRTVADREFHIRKELSNRYDYDEETASFVTRIKPLEEKTLEEFYNTYERRANIPTF